MKHFKEHKIRIDIGGGYGFFIVDIDGRNEVFYDLNMEALTPEQFTRDHVLQAGLAEALATITFRGRPKADKEKFQWALHRLMPKPKKLPLKVGTKSAAETSPSAAETSRTFASDKVEGSSKSDGNVVRLFGDAD